MNPKVSIIIPNYNHSPYLDHRIKSVLCQTYRDYEVIILDDCSTDSSVEIIERYRNHPKVSQIIINSENSGSTFKQWNKGVNLAKGEYIWFAESDDYAELTFLEELVPVLEQNSNVGIAKCKTQTIDSEYNKKEIIEDISLRPWGDSQIINGRQDCLLQLKYGISIHNASGVLVRKSIYLDVGYADENFKVTGDWMTWCKILLKSDLAYINKVLNYLRETHADTARQKYIKSYNGLYFLEDLKVVSYLIDNTNPSKELIKEVLDRHICRWISFIFTLHGTHVPFSRNVEIFKTVCKIDVYALSATIKYILLRPFRAVTRRLLKRNNAQQNEKVISNARS